jgi:arylsulfatase A-like enzyme
VSPGNGKARSMSKHLNITRRGVLVGSAALAVGLSRSRAQTNVRPNIVFILADDMGYADASCYGRRDFETPSIDSIALNGVRFLQGYANSAVCSATRTGLITGRYQYRLRVGLEEPILPGNPDVGLPPDHPTLPSLLKKTGYATALVGKWHLGILPKFGPLKSGYDRFYGFRGAAIDYFTHAGLDHKDDFWNNDTAIREVGYATELFGNRAVDLINEFARGSQPFFLSVHFNAPHFPWEDMDDEAESQRLRNAALTHYDGGTQRTYRRMIQAMDFQIGRVLQTLSANGITENTIVIFTSDNGGERFSDTWPFTGRKTELLEGGLRIPAIVSWPARVRKGVTNNQVAISMDWMPTLLAAAGARPDESYPLDGMNLMASLTADSTPVARKLFWRYKNDLQQAHRDGDFKYLKIRNNTFLFNVVDDPMERANLKERRKDVFERLIKQWSDWNAEMLPIVSESFTVGFSADQLADHIGVEP